MRYTDPKLRELLAGEYVMATLPRRARARFERLMAADPTLAALVVEWQERLALIDATAPAAAPPRRVWHAIEAAIGPETAAAYPRPERAGWWHFLPLWRGLALGAAALAAALILYIAVPRPPDQAPRVVAVLADPAGAPAWLATAEGGDRVAVGALRPESLAPDKSLELWAIAGGPPKPLGLVPASGRDRLVLPASALPHEGVLAISLEPAGGSPTGGPTGPVLWTGKILPASF